MPPDPVLALLAVVGLFVYVGIGSVVATVSMGAMDRERRRYKHEGPSILAIAGQGGNETAWIGWWAMLVCWPVWIICCMAVGIVVGVLAGPVWMAKKIGVYSAKALVKETESD